MRFLVAGLLALMLLGACTSGGEPASTASRTTSPAPNMDGPPVELTPPERAIVDASRSSTTAPKKFRDRSQLPSCGEVASRNLTGPELGGFACLSSPRDAGAELAVLVWTQEGDPLVKYYRVGPGIDGVELFVDNTLDSYRSEDWTHQQRLTTRQRTARGL